jgi:hypothetical protein
MQRLAIFLVEVALETAQGSVQKLFFFLEVHLIALLFQHRLENDEDMFPLVPGEVGDRFPEAGLILFCHRFAVFHCEVCSEEVRERRPSVIDAFDLAFRLQDLIDLIFMTPGEYFPPGTALVSAGGSVLLNLAGRSRVVVDLVFGIGYDLRQQFRVFVLNFSHFFLEIFDMLPFDIHVLPQV